MWLPDRYMYSCAFERWALCGSGFWEEFGDLPSRQVWVGSTHPHPFPTFNDSCTWLRESVNPKGHTCRQVILLLFWIFFFYFRLRVKYEVMPQKPSVLFRVSFSCGDVCIHSQRSICLGHHLLGGCCHRLGLVNTMRTCNKVINIKWLSQCLYN